MSKQTVKEYLRMLAIEEGSEDDIDEWAIEILIESETVWEGEHDEHRWYIIIPTVKKINNLFIQYDDYLITGDNGMSDMGLKYDLDSAFFVKEKERIIVEKYYERL